MVEILLHLIAAILHVTALVLAAGLGNAVAKEAARIDGAEDAHSAKAQKADAGGFGVLIAMTSATALIAFTLQVLA